MGKKAQNKAVVGVKIHAYSDALPLKLLAAIIYRRNWAGRGKGNPDPDLCYVMLLQYIMSIIFDYASMVSSFHQLQKSCRIYYDSKESLI